MAWLFAGVFLGFILGYSVVHYSVVSALQNDLIVAENKILELMKKVHIA